MIPKTPHAIIDSFPATSLQYRFFFGAVMVLALFLWGCGSGPEDPLETIKQSMEDESTYSVVLNDMREEGAIFKDFYHKYLVVLPDKSVETDWFKVDENYYNQNREFLGMALLTKKEGEVNTTPSPPGYDFVGDSKYGRWQEDNSGNSFWEFYGKYALISSLFGGWYRPVYMNDYQGYQRHRAQNRPFFGKNKEFGSTGKIAKKKRPGFYSQRMAKKSSFANKLKKRIGRSKTGFRSRSGGFGK